MAKSGRGGKDGQGKGSLSLEDFKLWKFFTRDVQPMEGLPDWDAVEKEIQPLVKSNPSKASPEVREGRAFDHRSVAPEKPKPPQEAQLDGRTEDRLRRGKVPIEARLDLHGYTQDQAHRLLRDFVLAAHGSGKRCILVITGKGKGNRPVSDAWYEAPAGILKQKVPDWLTSPPLKEVVLKVYTAQQKDGGEGAYYVYLRRQREYLL